MIDDRKTRKTPTDVYGDNDIPKLTIEIDGTEVELPCFNDYDFIYLHGPVNKIGYEYAYMVEFVEGEYLDSVLQETFSGPEWTLLEKEVSPYEPSEKRIYGYREDQ